MKVPEACRAFFLFMNPASHRHPSRYAFARAVMALDFDWSGSVEPLVDFEDCVQEHVGPVGHVFSLSEFPRGMAHPAYGGHKDHPGGSDPGHVLGVMARPARHEKPTQPQAFSRLSDDPADCGVCRRRNGRSFYRSKRDFRSHFFGYDF